MESVNRLSQLLFASVMVLMAVGGPISPNASPYEKNTNMTMDHLIHDTMKGKSPQIKPGNVMVEMDMSLTPEQYAAMKDSGEGITKRKAVRDTKFRWTDNTMVYEFYEGSFKRSEKYLIQHAMTEWERYTCFRFRPATPADTNVVVMQNGVGCNSELGMVGGRQAMNLEEPGCRFQGLYLHEIGHAIGLVHEQQLPNRDDYIEIVYYNVEPHMREWFDKYSTDFVDQMGVAYQYSSIMHYGVSAFSADGKSHTILTKDRNRMREIGQVYLKDLGYTDVEIVNKMHNCAQHCPDQNKCGAYGHLDQNCDCICQDGSISSTRCNKPAASGSRTGACQNNYNDWTCNIFATQGLCERQKKYLPHNCAKACHVCQDWEPLTCKDHYTTKTCETWKERGDCVTNEEWMKYKCTKTCNRCPGVSRPEVDCEDTYKEKEKCKAYALNGECVVNPTWMSTHCRKSCQFCAIGQILGNEHLDKCVNKHTNETECVEWANRGECSFNPGFMLPQCRKACNACDSPIVDLVRKCSDNNDNCKDWAARGECESNPGYMLYQCMDSCKTCPDGTCKNLQTDAKCQKWADEMQCLDNRVWMEKNCAKACEIGVCSHIDTGEPGVYVKPSGYIEPKLCINAHNSDSSCEAWAKGGECDNNPTWMSKNCKKSCDLCYTGQCKNYHSSKKCDEWAASGECEANPYWMGESCQKSCGLGLCKGKGRVTTKPFVVTPGVRTTSKPKVTQPSECENSHGGGDKECEDWAFGLQCEINPGYMLTYCAKACGVCGGRKPTIDPTTCFNTDTDSNCEAAFEAGLCTKEPGTYLRTCKKACHNCRANCKDENPECESWMKNGHCESNPGYLLIHCQHSCNVC